MVTRYDLDMTDTSTGAGRIAAGRVALVTGASKGGTGTAIARRLAAEGCRVAITARSADGLISGWQPGDLPAVIARQEKHLAERGSEDAYTFGRTHSPRP